MLCDLDKAVDLGISVAQADHDTSSTAIAHLIKLLGLLRLAYKKTQRPNGLHLAAQYTKTLLRLVQSNSNGNELR
jgi:hypothetical protein